MDDQTRKPKQKRPEYENEEDIHKRAEASRKKKRLLKREQEIGVKIATDSDEADDYYGEDQPLEQDIDDELEHGTILEPFNLHQETRDRIINVDSGVVDTRAKKEDEEDEAWLQEFDENMKNDGYASKIFDIQEKLQNAEEPEFLEETSAVQLLDEISDMLRWGETVTKALNRLRPPKQPKTTTRDSKKEPTEFDILTNKADQLLRVHGIHDIFSQTKEDLLDTIDRLNGVDNENDE